MTVNEYIKEPFGSTLTIPPFYKAVDMYSSNQRIKYTFIPVIKYK